MEFSVKLLLLLFMSSIIYFYYYYLLLLLLLLGKKAVMQRGSIEQAQIIYIRSNRRMKQLMDWAGVVSVRLGAIAE